MKSSELRRKVYEFEDDGSSYLGRLVPNGKNHATGNPLRYKYVITLESPRPTDIPNWPNPKIVWESPFRDWPVEDTDTQVNATIAEVEQRFHKERFKLPRQIGLFA